MNLKEIKKIPQKDLQDLINKVRHKIKKSKIVKNLFDEYEVDLDELDLIPMCFADLPVSARTEKGVIYFNYRLLEDDNFSNDDHYMVHEITHWLQQTTGTKGTSGFTDDTYLDDENEQEGFNNQTKYLANTRNKQVAEEYADHVLDHHEISGEKRNKIKNKILNTKKASKIIKLHKNRLEEIIYEIGRMTSARDIADSSIIRIMTLLDIEIRPLAEKNQDIDVLEDFNQLSEIYQSYLNNKGQANDLQYLVSLAIRNLVRTLRNKNY